MIGIVLVSHSHRIAEGAAELAREMGGPDVRIETAGGLDAPDHPIGTDAVLVQRAIERAWSEEGVLVLMDLGSAVLSAEMALDLIPEERRDRVLLTEAPFIEGAVAAAVTARVGGPLSQAADEARGATAAKAAHLGTSPVAGPQPGTAPVGGQVASIRIAVGNPHGLHARPAARFVQTASAFDADVRVSNATTGRGPVSARSLNGVATLGVIEGHEIEVNASGPQATEAITSIRALADRGFDDVLEPTPSAARAPAGPGDGLRGLPASGGVAVGQARRFHVPPLEIPDDLRSRGPDEEERRLERALRATRQDVEAQRASVASRAGPARAAIFEAHLLLLRDEALTDPAASAIAAGIPAARAWSDAVDEVARDWEALEDGYQRARAADLRSVGAQVLARLLDAEVPRPRLDAPGILVAADLAPADAAALDPTVAFGVATAFGGPTSHAAVLARSLGIPAVVGIGPDLLAVPEGILIAIDGDQGAVYVRPPADVAHELERRRSERAALDRAARATAAQPARTRDGTRVEVAANVGAPADVPAAVGAGCDGVGLFRTEFLFLDRDRMPSEDEQEAAYREAAERLGGRPMILRTLDVGADKPLPFLDRPQEGNPFLGVRGVRLGLARPELLEVQLRAIVRVAVDHPVRVMFPMVATVDELSEAREALHRARETLASRGHTLPERLEVGIMVEVPSAALTADRLAPLVDFFSVGTNDLTQYVLAAERGNERVAPLADPLHPAVLELIRRTATAAERAGRWTGVCGELAADPLATPLLLGLGARELSMSALAIPHVKEAVRRTDLASAAALAAEALGLPTAAAVRGRLHEAAEGA